MDDGVQEARIELACKELRMPGLRQQFRSLAREAMDSDMSYLDFLVACLEQELLSRN